jgi:hypothetical protein
MNITMEISGGNDGEKKNVLSLVWVTRNGVWIGNWIYWKLTDRNYNLLQRYR